MPRSFDSVFYGAAGTSTGGPPDDEFNRVSFLSHFDGANNGVNNAFDDGSASNHTITANGNVTQGSFGPFARPDGEFGVSFDGTNDGLRLQSSDFGISTEAFTAECWVFPTKVPDDSDSFMWCMDATQSNASGNTWAVRANSGKVQIFTVSSNSLTTKNSTASLNINAWNHVAISRSGTTMYVALNGTVESATCASSLNNQQYLHIGYAAASGPAYFFQGMISNARYLVGTALYTSDYTVPTSKLTAITNTDLLTCQSNRFVDNSASGHAITITGEPAVTAFGPFLTSAVYSAGTNGASGYFDGASATSVSVAAASAPNLNSASWTIEGWFYIIAHSGAANAAAGQFGGTNSNWWAGTNQYNATNKQGFQYYNTSGTGSANIVFGSALPTGSWLHLAWVNNNGTLTAYQNGVSVGTHTMDGTVRNLSKDLAIGNDTDGGTGMNGYICDFRMASNAVYTSNFTPPTAPLTAITNTTLLLNMADGQAIDSAAQNNLTLFGNANVSTDQAKFGNTSLHLDGTGDYVIKYAQDISGTGAFTVEMFLRLAAVGAAQVFYDTRPSGTNGVYPELYVNSDNTLNYYVSGANRITSSETLSVNTWYHVALCRSGTSTKLFLNGTQVGSTYSDSNNYLDSGHTYLGRSSYADQFPTNCFIDEIRFSKMARYTSNFTAPTEPFADKGQ